MLNKVLHETWYLEALILLIIAFEACFWDTLLSINKKK